MPFLDHDGKLLMYMGWTDYHAANVGRYTPGQPCGCDYLVILNSIVLPLKFCPNSAGEEPLCRDSWAPAPLAQLPPVCDFSINEVR
jgi:hypothetical protein